MTSVNDILPTEQQHEGESATPEGMFFPWLFLTLIALVVFGGVAATVIDDAGTAAIDGALAATTAGAVWPF